MTLAGSVLSNTKLPVAVGDVTPDTTCVACMPMVPSPKLSNCVADKVRDQLPAVTVGVRSSTWLLLPVKRRLSVPLPLTWPVRVIGAWLYSCWLT